MVMLVPGVDLTKSGFATLKSLSIMLAYMRRVERTWSGPVSKSANDHGVEVTPERELHLEITRVPHASRHNRQEKKRSENNQMHDALEHRSPSGTQGDHPD